jgi:antitoxin component of RelBE/YafQ-DinJ toxin-antitoxin module
MGAPISVRLDDEVRRELETQARDRGIGLSTLLRELATRAAREAEDARIREASAAVARYVRSSKEAQEFMEDWGTPTTHVG